MRRVLLAIDVGNTETKLGCFAGDGTDLVQSWRVSTDATKTPDEYGVFFAQLFATAGLRTTDVDGVAVASVVPKLDQTLDAACKRYFRCDPLYLKAHRQSIMPVKTDRPGEVGADLVAAAIGAVQVYGAPLIVISYGTATVFMAVSPASEYLGVAIAPGIDISIDALVARTAKLPQISLEAPQRSIGSDTISALQSGIVYGFVGQTEAIVARMRAEMGVEANVIATGGMAHVLARHTAVIAEVNAHLSLIGLRTFYRDARASS